MRDPEWWKKPILRHCPEDCQDRKTCHRGVELPGNKNICYNPPESSNPNEIQSKEGDN